MSYLLPVQSEYKDILEIFASRLRMKHLLKSTSHRDMTPSRLFIILHDEVSELGQEINKKAETKTIEEACDVMISALLIADKMIWGGFE